MVKLRDENIREMVKRVSSVNFTIEQASWIYGITKRRVQQLTKIYRDTEEIPKLKSNKRPTIHLRDNTENFIKT